MFQFQPNRNTPRQRPLERPIMSQENSAKNITDAEAKRSATSPAPVVVGAASIVQNRGQLSDEEINRQIKLFG